MLAAVSPLVLACLCGTAYSWGPSSWDSHWSQVSYLKTCATPQEEASSKGEMTSDTDFKALVASFGLTPNTDAQKSCMLNSEKHKITTDNLKKCVPLMAPGAFGDVSVAERRYGSRGQLPYELNGTHYAMCKVGRPCKEFNKFLVNGSLLALAYECGTAENLLKLMSKSYFRQTAVEAMAMQTSSTGKTDQCYTTVKESGDTFSVRGPVYGPIFYINMAFAYMLGGEDYLKKFPGCRVQCEKENCEDVPLKPLQESVQI